MASFDHQSPEREREHAGLGDPLAFQVSPGLMRESVIIFDWDDTILPTSWLERIRALTAGVPLRPEVARQMSVLCAACAQTMRMAEQMGTVVFITNSAPGWVDQSCQLFMPQIIQQVRGYPIFAKPMHAPLTFKLSAFRRECQAFRNLVSVGDGDAERAASLRLLTPPDRKAGARGGDPVEANRIVKSVKLCEFPSCQQLIAQHEMLQVRLLDIVTFQGSLDLKARFSGSMAFGSPGGQAKASSCTLVHFPRTPGAPGLCQPGPPSRASQVASPPSRPAGEDGGTAASSKMREGLMLLKSLPPGLRTPLPPLGGPGSPAAVGRGGGDETPGSPVEQGSGSPAGFQVGAARARDDRVANANDPRLPGGAGDLFGAAAEAANASCPSGAGSSSEDLPGGPWKMQSMGDRGSRSPYQTPTKKRPVLASSLAASPGGSLAGLRAGRGSAGGAVWREGSAPAATRGSG